MSSNLRILAISLVALLASACTAAGAGPTSEPTESPAPSASPAVTGIVYPTGAADLVLRLRYVGGFMAPGAQFTTLPAIVVYGDGTVIVPGPQIEIYPGPALPNLQRATISPAGMQVILEAASEAGLLGPDAHYDLPGIADASSAEFTINADGRVHVISAYALMEGSDEPQPSDPAVAAARSKLASFRAQLGDLEALLGSELGSWSPYQPEAMQLLVSPGAPDAGQGLVQEPAAWPLSTPLAAVGSPLPELMEGQRCGVVSGGDLDRLMPLLKAANTLTPWTDGGASFAIGLRPVLPGEGGCEAPTQ